jgi:hypothetical protein
VSETCPALVDSGRTHQAFALDPERLLVPGDYRIRVPGYRNREYMRLLAHKNRDMTEHYPNVIALPDECPE